VWPDAFVEEGSIANNISMLRKILNPHFDGDGPIATVARRGYRFTAPVTLKAKKAPEAVISDSGPLDEESTKRIASTAGGAGRAGGAGGRAVAIAIVAVLAIVAALGFTAMRGSKRDPATNASTRR